MALITYQVINLSANIKALNPSYLNVAERVVLNYSTMHHITLQDLDIIVM